MKASFGLKATLVAFSLSDAFHPIKRACRSGESKSPETRPPFYTPERYIMDLQGLRLTPGLGRTLSQQDFEPFSWAGTSPRPQAITILLVF